MLGKGFERLCKQSRRTLRLQGASWEKDPVVKSGFFQMASSAGDILYCSLSQ